jgi:hypothetical protein
MKVIDIDAYADRLIIKKDFAFPVKRVKSCFFILILRFSHHLFHFVIFKNIIKHHVVSNALLK